jgi:hypothetical protein
MHIAYAAVVVVVVVVVVWHLCTCLRTGIEMHACFLPCAVSGVVAARPGNGGMSLVGIYQKLHGYVCV